MSRVFLPHVITDDSALGGRSIERSVRFNTTDSTEFYNNSLGTSMTGNRQICTISVWFKRVDSSSGGMIEYGYGGYNATAYGGGLKWDSSGRFFVTQEVSNSTTWKVATTRVFRDFNSWYHVVVAVDTTQATASNRVKIYINGVQESDFSTETYPSENYSSNNLGYNKCRIGASNGYSDARYYSGWNGYLAEYHFIDGQYLDPSYFGFTDGQTGIWRPKKVIGVTYGNNGHYLDFKDNTSTTTLGYDRSGNGLHFSNNNLSVAVGKDDDSMIDTPTNNFPTFNTSNRSSGPTISQGNLRMYYNYKPASKTTRTTFRFPKSGKYYYEWQNEESSSNPGRWQSGIINVVNETSTNYDIQGYNDADIVSYSYGGSTWFGTTHTSVSWDGTTRTWYSPERAAWAVDCDTGNVWVGRVASDGTTQWWAPDGSATGNPSKFLNPTGQIDKDITHHYLPFMSWHEGGSASSTAFAVNINFGQHSFLGTVPDGFKTLSSANMPTDPTIKTVIRPEKHFKCIAYDGDGSSDRNITGLEFKPDLIWIKNRTQASTYSLQDSTIGFGDDKTLRPDTSNAQDTNGNLYGYVNNTFNGGFNLNGGSDHGSSRVNSSSSGAKHIAWCWKAGGNSNTFNVDGAGYASASAAGITDGSISLTNASVNREAGFSIVRYTGTGSSGTVGHGLSATPNIVITKSRSATGSWAVLDTVGNSTAEYGLFLNDNGGYSSYQGGTYWSDTLPTSTVFTVNSNAATNASGVTYVAYCWTEIPGYSKFGTYKGNGNDDGPFIHTGFRPAWVTVKNTSASNNWQTWDNARETSNVMQRILEFNDASTSDDASSNTAIDFLSNGFKHRTSFQRSNTSGGTYIYMAFAEEPGTTPFDTFPNAR